MNILLAQWEKKNQENIEPSFAKFDRLLSIFAHLRSVVPLGWGLSLIVNYVFHPKTMFQERISFSSIVPSGIVSLIGQCSLARAADC